MESETLLDSLGRMPGEGRAARAALLDYARMERRSLANLALIYSTREQPPTKRLATLKRWSSRYRWQDRLVRWDQVQAAEEVAEWERRKTEVREADWAQGKELREKVFTLLDKTQDPLSISRLVTALRNASEMQRLAALEPTEIGLSGAALDDYIERELERLANSRKAPVSGEAADDGDTED